MMSNVTVSSTHQLPEASKKTVMHIISGDLWAGAEMQAFTLIRSLQSQFNLVIVLMNDGELAQRLHSLDIRVHIINERLNTSLSIIGGLRHFIIEYRPDIIHTHRIKENILGALANIIAHFPGKRTACLRTAHGASEHATGIGAKIRLNIDRLIANHCQDAVIAVSGALANTLKKDHQLKRIQVIPNGVDIGALRHVKPNADIQAMNATNIGIVGRLEPVKRLDIFLEMANILRHTSPDTSFLFHIVGDGSLKPALQAHISRLNMNDIILFHGHQRDAHSFIAAMDVVVMCSDHEGTPMTALETLGLGKPLIAHAVGGLKEILSTQQHYLVSSHTPEAYAKKVQEILYHSNKLAFLPDAYHQSLNTIRTIEIYQSLLV